MRKREKVGGIINMSIALVSIALMLSLMLLYIVILSGNN